MKEWEGAVDENLLIKGITRQSRVKCETALSNEKKTKELSFPAFYHIVL